MKILIVEDEASTQLAVKLKVMAFGYDILTASDGEDALRYFRNEDDPSIVLLDWMMPNMNGLDLCIAVRKMQLRIPPYLIMLTQKTEPDDVAQALDAGADDYVRKPFSEIELRARLAVGKRYIEAREKIRVLSGMLPICCVCKKIRDDKQYWSDIERYIQSHADVQFSHSICPDCLKETYPEYAEDVLRNRKEDANP